MAKERNKLTDWLITWWKWIVITLVGATIIWIWQRGEPPRGWPKVKTWLGNAIHFLATDVPIPRWWYWLFLLVFVQFLAAVLYVIWIRTYGKTYRAYTEDDFDGFHWRWKWSKEGAPAEGKPYQLTAYCKKCDLALNKIGGAINLGPGGSKPQQFHCSGCNTTYMYGDPDLVCEKILKIVRDNQWRQRLKSVKNAALLSTHGTRIHCRLP